MVDVRARGMLNGVKVTSSKRISHLLFVDDVLLFRDGSPHEFQALNNTLELYKVVTGMEINVSKSYLLLCFLSMDPGHALADLLHFPCKSIDDGLKYFGFYLKHNSYKNFDWIWLFKKVEAHISHWFNRLISHGGGLVLLKSILEIIPVYWNSSVMVPKGILTKIKKERFIFLWSGNRVSEDIPS
jgi:hypothetical protein